MSDLRLDFAGLLRDRAQACPDTEMVRELPSLQSAWDGSFYLSSAYREWYLRTFLGPQEAGRVLRALRAVSLSARGRVPADVVAEIESSVLEAMYPSAFEIAVGATRHPANQVAAGLRELGATEARWRTKYS